MAADEQRRRMPERWWRETRPTVSRRRSRRRPRRTGRRRTGRRASRATACRSPSRSGSRPTTTSPRLPKVRPLHSFSHTLASGQGLWKLTWGSAYHTYTHTYTHGYRYGVGPAASVLWIRLARGHVCHGGAGCWQSLPLLACCGRMQVHDGCDWQNAFGLGVQIMDPKMDSGINAEGVYTFEEALKAGILPTEFTVPQVIAIMDKLLCCEVYLPSSLSWK